MRNIILTQHEQIPHAADVNKAVAVDGTFDSIVLAGMGGSGHPGDLLNALGLTTVPLYVHRDYDLPLEYLGHLGLKRPLIITSSYSGNTEEALSAYQAAQKTNLPILGSASGGTLKEWCERDNVPFCLIDHPGMQPRHTLFAATIGIYTALKNSGLADNITADLDRTAAVLAEKTAGLEPAAKELAQQIAGSIPVYASPDTLGFAAKNFKIQTNENAKYPGFWNTLPELNHNELVGFSKLTDTNNPNKFIVIMLHDDDAHDRVKARMTVTADLYRTWGVTVADFTAQGESLLEKLFHTVTFGLWTTYHLAVTQNVDPVPVEGVEDFKAKLKEVAGDV